MRICRRDRLDSSIVICKTRTSTTQPLRFDIGPIGIKDERSMGRGNEGRSELDERSPQAVIYSNKVITHEFIRPKRITCQWERDRRIPAS